MSIPEEVSMIPGIIGEGRVGAFSMSGSLPMLPSPPPFWGPLFDGDPFLMSHKILRPLFGFFFVGIFKIPFS